MWPDDTGDGTWDPALWQRDGALDNGPQVVANDVLTQTTTSQGSDNWSGWLKGLVGNVANYAVAKDAARSGLTQARSPTGQPIYQALPGNPAAAAAASNERALLIVGVLVVAAIVFAPKG